MGEAQLVRKAMLGDAPALENLIGRYYDTIYAFCCRRMGDISSGSDVCQEAFLKMVQNLPKYRERGYFKSWLFTIASNCCNDAFRKKRPTAGLDESIADDSPAFEQGTENAMLLKTALDKLPAEQREVVILRYYHDFSTNDVARVQHIPAATVKTRLYRGLKKLQKLLGEDILLET
ncbi:RNA polymerase sigma factor [Christensenellaceae bacterium OttesenSCG-928-K19]|nr:RNA polymerase sigma factor [Christensenellaceae bacterium OttesenSCG-928-K19]